MDVGRTVEGDLDVGDTTLPQLAAGPLVEEIAVGDDARRVRHVRRVAALDERIGEREQRTFADQWLTPEPRDVELSDLRELRLDDR